jgi:putative transposase
MSDVTDTARVGRGRREGEQEEGRFVDRELAKELVERACKQGVELLGENGLLRAMTKAVQERGLAEELTEHLGCEPHERAGSINARNGSTPKRLHTGAGTVRRRGAGSRPPAGVPRTARPPTATVMPGATPPGRSLTRTNAEDRINRSLSGMVFGVMNSTPGT